MNWSLYLNIESVRKLMQRIKRKAKERNREVLGLSKLTVYQTGLTCALNKKE